MPILKKHANPFEKSFMIMMISSAMFNELEVPNWSPPRADDYLGPATCNLMYIL